MRPGLCQMNEPPGARPRRADRAHGRRGFPRQGPGRSVLHRQYLPFTQAGSEVSALLGRIPSRSAISRHSQPTWETCRNDHHNHQGLDHLGASHLRAGDDLTDPAPATSFAQSRCDNRLVRAIAEKGIYPRSIRSTRHHACYRRLSWRGALCVARQVQQILQRYKGLQDIIAILGMDELSKKTR